SVTRAATISAPASRAAASRRPSNEGRLATTRPVAGGRPAAARSTPAPARLDASVKRAVRMTHAGSAAMSSAPATSASARPVTPPPHGFSRGWVGSTSATRAPRRASEYAAHAPAGPAPRIETSVTVIHYTAMIEAVTGLFTIGVFQDTAWATKGLDALKEAGFPPESLTIVA